MAKIQGQRVGSIKNLKKKLKEGGSGTWIKFIPRDGSLMVRFLTEPDDFYGYWEHYDSTISKSYACVEDDCPGCATDEDRNFVYLANAVDLENDRVIPVQLKKSVVNDLVLRYEKYDTITDRDYELSKVGEGKNTRYMTTPEAPKNRKLAKYELLDLEDVVSKVFEENTALLRDEDDDDDEPVKKAAAKKAVSKAKAPAKKAGKKVEPEPDADEPFTEESLAEMSEDELEEAARDVDLDPDDYDDWDDLREAILEAVSGTDEDEEDESEEDEAEEDEDDEDEDEEDEDESDFWTEAELKAKTPGELKAIAKDYNISTKGLRPAQIIEKLLEA